LKTRNFTHVVLLWFIGKHRHNCFRAGARGALPVRASWAKKKWVYRLLISFVWVISGFRATSFKLLTRSEETFQYGLYNYATYSFICILINCVSYTSIIIKVCCGEQPQHHGAAGRKRKLTMTLLIMTVVSMLLYLPPDISRYAIFITKFEILRSLPSSVAFHLYNASLFSFHTNSFVNPIFNNYPAKSRGISSDT